MVIPMDENEDFQHLEEMIANLQAKQKQILKGMLDYPIEIDSAIRILSEPSRQLATTAHNLTRVHKILKELEKQGLVSFRDCQYSDRGTSKLKSLCSIKYRHRLPKKISHIYHI